MEPRQPIDLSPEARALRQWIAMAVGVVLLAGFFAVILVLGRTPPFDTMVGDPQFFRRCLVVHVNLALIVWFYAFIAGLTFLLPRAGASGRVSRHAVQIAMAGVVVMGAAALIPNAEPVLSNYVPMIDHPLFAAGQVLFAGGVLASFLDGRLLPTAGDDTGWMGIDPAAVPGLRATGVALVLAAMTFVASTIEAPVGVTPDVWHELA